MFDERPMKQPVAMGKGYQIPRVTNMAKNIT